MFEDLHTGGGQGKQIGGAGGPHLFTLGGGYIRGFIWLPLVGEGGAVREKS